MTFRPAPGGMSQLEADEREEAVLPAIIGGTAYEDSEEYHDILEACVLDMQNTLDGACLTFPASLRTYWQGRIDHYDNWVDIYGSDILGLGSDSGWQAGFDATVAGDAWVIGDDTPQAVDEYDIAEGFNDDLRQEAIELAGSLLASVGACDYEASALEAEIFIYCQGRF